MISQSEEAAPIPPTSPLRVKLLLRKRSPMLDEVILGWGENKVNGSAGIYILHNTLLVGMYMATGKKIEIKI